MILSEWLAYISTVSTYAVNLELTRVNIMVAALGLQHWNCPIITVAGTNGKGSCVALSSSILQAAGYQVGSFFSPHLYTYQERICINGQAVQEPVLCNAFERINHIRKDIPLTYFEFGTLAALLIFQQSHLDVLVLEVGLGGRFDAVNSIDSDIAIISSIDLDHMQWLGPTRAHIAKEKAGIMRARNPCVWGDTDQFPSVTEYARDLQTPLFCQNKEFGWYKTKESTWTWWNQTTTWHDLPRPRVYLANAACVLQAMYLLQDRLNISPQAIRQGLKAVFLPGRFQVLNEDPITRILDVAHNPASARLLAEQMKNLPVQGRCFAVVGMLNTKDIRHTLSPLIEQVDSWHLGTLNAPNGANAEQLADCLSAPVESTLYSTVTEAYNAAIRMAHPGDCILIFGSFHTVSEVMQSLSNEKKSTI